MNSSRVSTASEGNRPGLSSQAPKLLERLRMLLEERDYRSETVNRFVAWNRQDILFHGKRHPETLGREHVEAFLDHVAALGYGADLQKQARQSRGHGCGWQSFWWYYKG